MKFLLDECLQASLRPEHLCKHFNFLGLEGNRDWQLIATIRNADYTVVTNNRTDFTALYAQEELLAGLAIVIPNVVPSCQRELFQTALAHIGQRDLTNIVPEVTLVGAAAMCREYPYPGQ